MGGPWAGSQEAPALLQDTQGSEDTYAAAHTGCSKLAVPVGLSAMAWARESLGTGSWGVCCFCPSCTHSSSFQKQPQVLPSLPSATEFEWGWPLVSSNPRADT